MGIVSEILKKQRKLYFTYLWKGFIFSIVGIWGGFGVLINGLGESAKNTKGYYLQQFLTKLSEKNESVEKLIPYWFSGFFFTIAAIGIFYFLRGILHIAPSRTMLGRSILKQKKSYESWKDCKNAIEMDIESRCTSFGNVSIGGEWVVENEVMRIVNIRGIFSMDAAKNDYVLCLVDEKQNVWAVDIVKKEDRDLAVAHLKERVPEAITGNREDYMAFLSQENASETKDSSIESENLEIQYPNDISLSFKNIDGIPTSNFSFKEVLGASAMLAPMESITLSVLGSPKIIKGIDVFHVSLHMLQNSQRSVSIEYKKRRQNFKAHKEVEQIEAEKILGVFLTERKLLDFSNWIIEEI